MLAEQIGEFKHCLEGDPEKLLGPYELLATVKKIFLDGEGELLVDADGGNRSVIYQLSWNERNKITIISNNFNKSFTGIDDPYYSIFAGDQYKPESLIVVHTRNSYGQPLNKNLRNNLLIDGVVSAVNRYFYSKPVQLKMDLTTSAFFGKTKDK